MAISTVEYIACGKRENMMAEFGAFDPTTIDIPAKRCRYLVLPIGVAQYDTEWFGTKKEALEYSRYLAREEADYQERKVSIVVI
jgi:hypothetical protein